MKKLNINSALLKKRLFGVTLAMFVLWLFNSNVESDCIYVVDHKLKNNHIAVSIMSLNSENSSTVSKKEKTVKNSSSPHGRYDNIKTYNKHAFFTKVINDNSKIIHDICQKENVNPSVVMAQFILESHRVDNGVGVVTRMGREKHNYFCVKHKGDDPFFSIDYKNLLNECAEDNIYWQKDDDYENGKLKESAFYTFKSKWYGIRAGIGFIGDRVRSNHPQWRHFKNVDVNNTEAWAYALYQTGYANKNTSVPYDKKIMRLIKVYGIEKIMDSY